MASLPFFKYQGTGNDFVIIDNRESVFDHHNTELITRLCNRKFGVGSDGLILLNAHPEHDFEMIYFNADATRAGCGNGARCAVHLAHHLGIIGREANFMMEGQAYQAQIEAGRVRIRMSDVAAVQSFPEGYLLHTGTRHFVRLVEGLLDYEVVDEGRELRYDPRFLPEGTNVNFVELKDHKVHMRIYEKGVENETLSSGTGATAVALALAHARQQPSPVAVHTRGGVLEISFTALDVGSFTQVYMAGPAQMVFQGTVFV
jgi:diaminopimelate epimerase